MEQGRSPAPSDAKHLDGNTAARFVAPAPVPEWVQAHLSRECEPCLRLVGDAFDQVVRAVEDGTDRRDVAAWLRSLGDRHARRYCCPTDLVGGLTRRDQCISRHVRHCPLCAEEASQLDVISRMKLVLPDAPRVHERDGHRPSGR